MTGYGIDGKTALVTGAASGIGAAAVAWLDAAGAGRIVAVDRDAAGLRRLECRSELVRLAGDVAEEALWQRLEDEHGDIACAALNAGIVGPGLPIVEIGLDAWRETLAVNLDGMFLGLRTALRVMIASGCKGSIVLTGSVSGVRAYGTADYAAGKAAVHHLAKVAAREAGPYGIRINAVAPGGVDTAIWNDTAMFRAEVERLGSREAAIAEMGKHSGPLGRLANAGEIAGHIGFLLSDHAQMITGAVLPVDGGLSV